MALFMRQSSVAFGTISVRLLLENVSYSAQCLDRQWIQYLRQSTELVNYRGFLVLEVDSRSSLVMEKCA